MTDSGLQKTTVSASQGAVSSGSQKPTKADDPMQMRADFVSGDQRVMLQCLIEEFAHMGWDAKQITRMFENPFFLATHGLTQRFGSETVREYIEQGIARCGVFHCVISETKSVAAPQSVTISANVDALRRVKSKPKTIDSGTLNGDCDYG